MCEPRSVTHLLVSLLAEVDGALVGHVAFSAVSAATGALGVRAMPELPRSRINLASPESADTSTADRHNPAVAVPHPARAT